MCGKRPADESGSTTDGDDHGHPLLLCTPTFPSTGHVRAVSPELRVGRTETDGWAGDQRRGPACTDKSSPPCFRGTPHLRERQETTLAQAVVHYQRRVPVVTAEADQQRTAVPCRMSM